MANDPAKLRAMSAEEMAIEENELRAEIWKLRLQLTTGQLQDPQKVRRTRKDLARLKTVRRETELAAGRKGER